LKLLSVLSIYPMFVVLILLIASSLILAMVSLEANGEMMINSSAGVIILSNFAV